MDLKERFINYIKIDTTSNENSASVPSTACQLELSDLLVIELEEMGINDVVQDRGYIYAKIPSNIDYQCKTVGFIAHLDTSFDFNGANIKPREIIKWNGEDIHLNDEMVISIAKFDKMHHFVGDDIIVTDGTSLLGADDKAGVAIIMDMAQYLMQHPEVKHGDVMLGFTVDEEIGRGADAFDVATFNADFAYTLDGGCANEFCYETFNAYKVDVEIEGVSIHPGSAKNQMINALRIINEFDNLLPAMMRPEYTDNDEGFNHMYNLNGTVEHVHAEYIVRNHNHDIILNQIKDFENARDFINTKYKRELVKITHKLQYKNMYELLKDNAQVLLIGEKAIAKAGLEVEIAKARGGTDGSRLTFMGLPCPNLGTGSMNHHGPYECASISQMRKLKEIALNIVELTMEHKL